MLYNKISRDLSNLQYVTLKFLASNKIHIKFPTMHCSIALKPSLSNCIGALELTAGAGTADPGKSRASGDKRAATRLHPDDV